MTGDFVDAGTALRVGWGNHVVAQDDTVPLARRLATSIAEGDRAMIRTMRVDWDPNVGTALDEGRRIHEEHAARGRYRWAATRAVITNHRDQVLARERAQQSRS